MNERCLHLSMPKINGHEFNYSAMKDSLLEVLIDFALIRATIQKYVENRRYARLYIEAKSKIISRIQMNLVSF